MTSDDDLDDLLSVGGEEQEKEKKLAKKRERKAYVRNVILLLLVLGIVVGSYFAFMSFQDYQEKQSRIQAEQSREDIMLQPINTQQVEWADNTCAIVSAWKQKDFPVYDKEVDPNKVRKDMVVSLRDNAKIMYGEAEKISLSPYTAHDKALEAEKHVLLTDNVFLVDPEKNDPSTSKASQSLAVSIRLYAQSMNDMAKDLEKIADYDIGGQRTAIIRVSTMLEKMNKEMEKEMNGYLKEDIFTNNVTKEKILSLESCNEKMFSQEELEKKYGEELKEQSILRDIIVTDRCQDFLANTADIATPYEVAEKNIKACEEYIATHPIDPNNPVSEKNILNVTVDMAYPPLELDESEEAPATTTGAPTPASTSNSKSPDPSKAPAPAPAPAPAQN